MTARAFGERLRRRARRAGLQVPVEAVGPLHQYFELLTTWNGKVNLTGIDLEHRADEAFDRLLLEPLAAVRHLPAGSARVLDVGSGGGSPAVPLKLFRPDVLLTMVEAKTRKSVFLREVVRALGLAETDIVNSRFEQLLAEPDRHEAHDVISIRAVRVEPRTLLGLQALLRPGGVFFLFRASSRDPGSDHGSPILSWRATFPLIESLGSRLIVLEKRRLGSPARQAGQTAP
ncbi:MAG: 16S rRNA (guanine(527)-N(7))-methyltransferase RsmG [Acidimicrobiia bacterium]|nr:16S rRNA (guanine(527)-N(7))-methyltransferase RsmG [Acidimicrobiia bacterium]